MNAKLLSDARKALTAQNRRQRENARVTLRRRQEALRGLAVASSTSPHLIDLLNPNEALSLIGGDLKTIRGFGFAGLSLGAVSAEEMSRALPTSRHRSLERSHHGAAPIATAV